MQYISVLVFFPAFCWFKWVFVQLHVFFNRPSLQKQSGIRVLLQSKHFFSLFEKNYVFIWLRTLLPRKSVALVQRTNIFCSWWSSSEENPEIHAVFFHKKCLLELTGFCSSDQLDSKGWSTGIPLSTWVSSSVLTAHREFRFWMLWLR